MDSTRKISFLVFILCVFISLKNQINKASSSSSYASYSSSSPFSSSSYSSTSYTDSADLPPSSATTTASTSSSPPDMFFSGKKVEKKYAVDLDQTRPLQYDFYRDTCPDAEQIIRSALHQVHQLRPDISPALLRLVFHDCFIEGCDASVLLDDAGGSGSEKDSLPNQSLKGFDIIDLIKSQLENECPGIVSCADILVLAARESVVLAGGPFYPLHTGRRDSTISYPDQATYKLPSPQDDLSKTISLFAERGFDERETVALLGAHSTGMIHCKFFHSRLNNFRGTGMPDLTLDSDFLNILRSTCDNNQSSPSSPLSSPSPSASTTASLPLSPSPSSFPSINVSAVSTIPDTAMKMDYEGPGRGFGTLYYRSLLQGKGLLFVDQQLTSGEETETWVRAYASDVNLFQRDFALVMMKLSDYHVLTAPMGQVRLDCRTVA
ncbi:putative Peroxidase 48 [Apium graveolens]|uniref:putative Peroxidase 48 n=1 Tax=Apium graveolens TaxID=4045 RepID=UPI003D79A83C